MRDRMLLQDRLHVGACQEAFLCQSLCDGHEQVVIVCDDAFCMLVVPLHFRFCNNKARLFLVLRCIVIRRIAGCKTADAFVVKHPVDLVYGMPQIL